MTSRAASRPLVVRFFEKFVVGEGCWEWIGALTNKGYGSIWTWASGGKRNVGAHRVSWVLAHGEIPTGKMVLHHCDNRKCVRPSHLYLGDVRANHRDMMARRRGTKSKLGLPYGVFKNGNQWTSRAYHDGKMVYVGIFGDLEQAAAEADRARQRICSDFAPREGFEHREKL